MKFFHFKKIVRVGGRKKKLEKEFTKRKCVVHTKTL
jgi:hypothetical protein